MNLETALKGLLDAEAKLSERTTMMSPNLISENMYRLGQYTAAVERHLGDIEEEYEVTWARNYTLGLEEKLSATAAKIQADVATSTQKGQMKRLSRYVSSSWRLHTGAMARINHLQAESRGAV